MTSDSNSVLLDNQYVNFVTIQNNIINLNSIQYINHDTIHISHTMFTNTCGSLYNIVNNLGKRSFTIYFINGNKLKFKYDNHTDYGIDLNNLQNQLNKINCNKLEFMDDNGTLL